MVSDHEPSGEAMDKRKKQKSKRRRELRRASSNERAPRPGPRKTGRVSERNERRWELEKLVRRVSKALLTKGFRVHRYDSYSTLSHYLKVDGGVCHSIRIADHPGKKHLKYRYNIGPFISECKTVRDVHERLFFTVDDVDALVEEVVRDREFQREKLGRSYGYAVDREIRMGERTRNGFWVNAREVTK